MTSFPSVVIKPTTRYFLGRHDRLITVPEGWRCKIEERIDHPSLNDGELVSVVWSGMVWVNHRAVGCLIVIVRW